MLVALNEISKLWHPRKRQWALISRFEERGKLAVSSEKEANALRSNPIIGADAKEFAVISDFCIIFSD